MKPDPSDELDGCELDFTEDAVDKETAELLPLFPQGAQTENPELRAAEWREVLRDA